MNLSKYASLTTGAEPSKGLTPELWMFRAAENDRVEIYIDYSDCCDSLCYKCNFAKGLKSVFLGTPFCGWNFHGYSSYLDATDSDAEHETELFSSSSSTL